MTFGHMIVASGGGCICKPARVSRGSRQLCQAEIEQITPALLQSVNMLASCHCQKVSYGMNTSTNLHKKRLAAA